MILPFGRFQEVTGVRFTLRHTGKLEHIYSLSTWKGDNKYCRIYSTVKEYVCSICYVDGFAKFYGKPFIDKLKRNSKILKNKILDIHLDLSKVKQKYFRFESFGDISTPIQVINYFQMCYDNPSKRFTLWTKNPFILAWVIYEKGYKKPQNLIIIYSSKKLNECESWILEKYPFIDKVFTVYTKKYLKTHNVKINCGSRKCFLCLKCYEPNDEKFINEEEK